jgi:hypothetical protein
MGELELRTGSGVLRNLAQSYGTGVPLGLILKQRQ